MAGRTFLKRIGVIILSTPLASCGNPTEIVNTRDAIWGGGTRAGVYAKIGWDSAKRGPEFSGRCVTARIVRAESGFSVDAKDAKAPRTTV